MESPLKVRPLRWSEFVRMVEAEAARAGIADPEICFIAMTHGPLEDLRVIDGKLCVLE